MSQRPRTTRYFPRMKVRGWKRQSRVPLLIALRAVDQFAIQIVIAANNLTQFGQTVGQFTSKERAIGAFQNGDPYTEYFQQVMARKRAEDPAGWIQASKDNL